MGKARTIAELIAELQKFPPDMPVKIEGYESGYDDFNIVQANSNTAISRELLWRL